MAWLYVCNALDDTISVVCTERNKEIDKLALDGEGLSPRRLLVHNKTIFHANAGDASVGYIATDASYHGTISVGTYPIGICRVKNKLFVCCGESNSVWRVDAVKKKAELCCGAGVFPISIIASKNDVFISCLLSCDMIRLAPSLINKKRQRLKAMAMCGIECGEGYLACCLAGEGKGELVLLDNELEILKRRMLESPVECLAMLPGGRRFVAAHLWDNALSIIDSVSLETLVTYKTNRMPDQVIAYGDRIYTSCIMSNCVDVFSTDGDKVATIQVGREPRGIGIA